MGKRVSRSRSRNLIQIEEDTHILRLLHTDILVYLHTNIYTYIPLHTHIYTYIPKYTHIYQYIPIFRQTYQYIPIHRHIYQGPHWAPNFGAGLLIRSHCPKGSEMAPKLGAFWESCFFCYSGCYYKRHVSNLLLIGCKQIKVCTRPVQSFESRTAMYVMPMLL